jgi:hypothetical protein
MTYKQMKLVNGDELIANVLDVQDDEGVLIVSEALRIVEVENIEEGISYFALRPMMSFTNDIDQLQIINTMHITVESFPSDSILKHYQATVARIRRIFAFGKTIEDLEELSEEEYDEFMSDVDTATEEAEPEEKLDGDNIITFKPKGTVH